MTDMMWHINHICLLQISSIDMKLSIFALSFIYRRYEPIIIGAKNHVRTSFRSQIKNSVYTSTCQIHWHSSHF